MDSICLLLLAIVILLSCLPVNLIALHRSLDTVLTVLKSRLKE